jgi:hypothetical protein
MQLDLIPRRRPEDYMSIKRKWLKLLVLMMMGTASAFSPVNPQELWEIMHIMNETKVEFSIPDDSDDGDDDREKLWRNIDSTEPKETEFRENGNVSMSNSQGPRD